MDAELRAKWIATLRAGTFVQAIGVLRSRDNRCCCLGVLCDIDDPEKWERPRTAASWTHTTHSALPHPVVLRKWGLKYAEADNLSRMNDAGKSFAEIADYIEANIPATPSHSKGASR